MSLRSEGEDVVQIRAQVIAAQMTSVTVDVIVGIQIVAAGVDVGEDVTPRSDRQKDVLRDVFEVFLLVAWSLEKRFGCEQQEQLIIVFCLQILIDGNVHQHLSHVGLGQRLVRFVFQVKIDALGSVLENCGEVFDHDRLLSLLV